jgi:hypothetical protein
MLIAVERYPNTECRSTRVLPIIRDSTLQYWLQTKGQIILLDRFKNASRPFLGSPEFVNTWTYFTNPETPEFDHLRTLRWRNRGFCNGPRASRTLWPFGKHKSANKLLVVQLSKRYCDSRVVRRRLLWSQIGQFIMWLTYISYQRPTRV